MKQFKNIQWVVQNNLSGDGTVAAISNACKRLGIDCIEVDIIPFSEALPEFPKTKKSIFYGSISFNNSIYADTQLNAGLFFNDSFSIERYFEKWGKQMLNFGAKVTTFEALVKMDYPVDKQFFIRPDNDDKSFAGEVKTFGEIEEWSRNLYAFGNSQLNPNTKIVVGEPYNIKAEWRLWIVNGRVIAASKYREYFKLKKERGCPQEVVDFAEERCREYTPHDVFVMDVCQCGDAFFIVECGCMNGSGFYNADVDAIVERVSDYFLMADR